jgi:hypothetical protein
MISIVVSRRSFIERSAKAAASLAFVSLLQHGAAHAAEPDPIGKMAGGGNFYNDEIQDAQYAVLDALRASAVRMAVYPAWYLGQVPQHSNYTDNAVVSALQHNANILYHCEYLSTYPVPPDRSYSTWFDIGRNLATRYSPGSSLLMSRGIPAGKGVTQWAAINEPDRDQALIDDYRNMIMGYADGIHSINPAARVYPGGYLSTNRDSEYTGHGYIPRIVDLINNGTLSGIDLHMFADKLYAPIENTRQKSAQHNFDAVVFATGISRNIDFIVSEHNFKNTASGQGYDEAYVKRMMLPHIFDVLGCAHNDNTPAVKVALAWNLFHQNGAEYYLTTGGTNWYQAGVVYKLVLDLLSDCHFVFNDPRSTGRYELTNANGSKYAWVFQNHHQSWSTEYGPWRQITFPFKNSLLRRYNHDGLKETTRIKKASSQRLTTPTGETSIWIAQL